MWSTDFLPVNKTKLAIIENGAKILKFRMDAKPISGNNNPRM